MGVWEYGSVGGMGVWEFLDSHTPLLPHLP
jgi:hypothetical protein